MLSLLVQQDTNIDALPSLCFVYFFLNEKGGTVARRYKLIEG